MTKNRPKSKDLNKVLKYLRDTRENSAKTVFYAFHNGEDEVETLRIKYLQLINNKLLIDRNITLNSMSEANEIYGFPFVELTNEGHDFIQIGGYSRYFEYSSVNSRKDKIDSYRNALTIIFGFSGLFLAILSNYQSNEIGKLEDENHKIILDNQDLKIKQNSLKNEISLLKDTLSKLVSFVPPPCLSFDGYYHQLLENKLIAVTKYPIDRNRSDCIPIRVETSSEIIESRIQNRWTYPGGKVIVLVDDKECYRSKFEVIEPHPPEGNPRSSVEEKIMMDVQQHLSNNMDSIVSTISQCIQSSSH